MLDVLTARKIGSPRRPTAAYDSSDVAATRSGVCGFWYGLGTAPTSWERQHLYGEPDLHALGPPGDRRADDERRGQHGTLLLEVQLGQPHRVVAELLGHRRLRQRVVEGLRLVDARAPFELGKEPDLHGGG